MTSKPTPHVQRSGSPGTSANRISAAPGLAASAATGHVPPGEAGQTGSGIPKPVSKRLHRKQASAYLGVSLSWLDKSRLKGDGPAYLQIGSRVIYDVADLDHYLARCRRRSTSEPR